MKALAAVLLMAVAAGKGKKPPKPPPETPADVDDAPIAPPKLGQSLAAAEANESYLSAAVGKPNGLKAADVAARAVETSPQAAIRAEEVNAARASAAQAVVAFFPRLAGGVKYSRLSFVADQSLGTVVLAPTSAEGPLPPGSLLVNAPATISSLRNQTGLQASVVVPLSDYLLRTPQTYGAASAGRDAAGLQLQATKLQVALDAKVAYYNWARAKLQALVAEQAVLQAKAHRTTAGNLFDAGNASKADVLRVDAQVAQAELLLVRARAGEAVLGEQVRTLMHDPQAVLEIGEDLSTALSKVDVGPVGQLWEQARGRRREVLALEKSAAAYDSQAWAARAGYLPRIDALASALYANPNPRYFPPKDEFLASWELGLQVSYSPNEIALAAAVTDGLVARRQQVVHQRDGFLDQLRLEIAQAAEAVKEADLSVESTKKGLAAAEESYRVRKELFQNERSTSVELTDAENNLTQARLNAISARIDQRVARARLEHATGEDLEAR